MVSHYSNNGRHYHSGFCCFQLIQNNAISSSLKSNPKKKKRVQVVLPRLKQYNNLSISVSLRTACPTFLYPSVYWEHIFSISFRK